MTRIHVAVALATALVALCPPLLRAAEAHRPEVSAQWQQVNDLHELVSVLDAWLDTHSKWSRRDTAPRIRIVSEWEARARQGATASFQRGRLRGLYDPRQAEILLVRPWDPRDAEDVSVLLHELVHHRQAPHHWYCPAAQELPAYRLQEAWLAERGMWADVNWVAVVLESGCTRRDIHPE